jgi:serine/threonine protein kinase
VARKPQRSRSPRAPHSKIEQIVRGSCARAEAHRVHTRRPVTRSRTATKDRLITGTRIGDYKVDCEVASEETGVVYLGTHVVLPRQAAIKVMHASSAWLRSVAIQMLREACILEALCHPGIPRVYECGVLPDRRPWTAFERIEGVSIATLIASGTLPLVDLVTVLRDVADLLCHAHSRGVAHRKLTADAIVRTTGRASRVCVRHWDNALTVDTEVRVAVDTRDDVHALGVIAFRCLTGLLPDRAVATRERCPAAPAELASLIDHMLASDPTCRPSADEVRSRARWLAETVEPLVLDKPRWTPPLGFTEAIPVAADDGFTVRISRRTS